MSSIESLASLQKLTGAETLYEEGPPMYVGTFILAREAAQGLPINLTEVFEPALTTLKEDPEKALQFARRFGKLSVNVALDLVDTSFTLEREGKYTAPNVAQIRTNKRYLPSDLFFAEECDAPYAYLLFDERSLTAEMGLIQALHMLDYALVSGQFDGRMPLFKAIGYDQLAELQGRYPDVYVRKYGNVRDLKGAPDILGTVIPTTILEDSNLDLPGFEAVGSDNLRAVELPNEREQATVIGITTAKRPHIGHGFLITKAVAEAGKYSQVVVELNDLGPRVARAVSALAAQLTCTTQQVTEAITNAEITPSVLEDAYRKRGDYEEADLPANFALTASNALYERLLTQFTAEATTISSLSNSSSQMGTLLNKLYANPLAQPLFGNTDMVLLGDEKATVIAQYGNPTMAGIIGALATGYKLTTVDSPAVLDRNQLKIFESASIPVRQVDGIGLSIGFSVASGTGGEAPTLQSFLANLPQGEVGSGQAIRVLRAVLNDSVFVRGDGNSLNPNFASVDFLQERINTAIDQIQNEVDIYKPMNFRNITRDIAKNLTPYSGDDGLATKGRISGYEVQCLIASLPIVVNYLSSEIVEYSLRMADTIPKNFITQQDTQIINKLRSGNTETVFRLLTESLEGNFLEVAVMEGTMLSTVMARMGYDLSDALKFIEQLMLAGGAYVLT